MVCAPVRSIIPSLKLGDYLSVQAHNPCSISHLFLLQVYGVQALNNRESTPFYKELADRSGGFYLQLRQFNLITDMFLAGKK